jgi:hypothetical protein
MTIIMELYNVNWGLLNKIHFHWNDFVILLYRFIHNIRV